MEYGWGFAALMAGLLLTGLVFVVMGVQMACGRWRHALAGAAGLSEREREAAGVAQAARVGGVLLVAVGAGVVGLGGWQAWTSYTPEADGVLTAAGVFLVLVDLFVAWALRRRTPGIRGRLLACPVAPSVRHGARRPRSRRVPCACRAGRPGPAPAPRARPRTAAGRPRG